MVRTLVAWILAATLLVPGVQARPAEGRFIVEGAIELPQGANMEAAAMAFFLGGSEELDPSLEFTQFLIESDSLTLIKYEKGFSSISALGEKHARTLPSDREPVTQTFRNVTITIKGGLQNGYVALENASPSSRVSLLATGPARVESVTRSEFADGDYAMDSTDKSPVYRRILDIPHARASAGGVLSFEGGGKMKLTGMTLVLTHDDGQELEIPTGNFQESSSISGSPVQSEKEVWVILTSEHLRVHIASEQDWILAGGPMNLTWDGKAAFQATSGVLETSAARYNASARRTHLDGVFDAALETVGIDSVQSSLGVVGDLTDTNLPRTQSKGVLPLPPGNTFLWIGLAFGIAVGAGGIAWRQRGRWRSAFPVTAAEPPLSPALAAEYYVGLAEQALQFEEHAKALHYISLAREASPTSSDVATTLAYVLGEMGHYDEALVAYADASRLTPTNGEADLNAARLAAQIGRPAEDVEALVLRALERSPEFVVDVEEDVEFRPLAIRPTFRAALARAWDRWGDDEASSVSHR